MSAPLLHKILSPAECFEVSALLEAKYLALRALPATETDAARVAREAAEAYTREVLGPLLVEQGYGEELCQDLSKGENDAPTNPVGNQKGVSPRGLRPQDVDPWDMPPEELNHTAALPRETPQWLGVDRGGFDPLDDKSDISPHSRTEKP